VFLKRDFNIFLQVKNNYIGGNMNRKQHFKELLKEWQRNNTKEQFIEDHKNFNLIGNQKDINSPVVSLVNAEECFNDIMNDIQISERSNLLHSYILNIELYQKSIKLFTSDYMMRSISIPTLNSKVEKKYDNDFKLNMDSKSFLDNYEKINVSEYWQKNGYYN